MMPRFLLSVIAVTIIFATSGCVGGALKSDAPPEIKYVLNADASLHQQQIEPMLIRVMTPELAEGLDSDHMMVLGDARHLSMLEQARWPGHLSEVLLDFFLESLNSVPGLTALSSQGHSVRADYRILLQVSDMQAEYGGAVGVGIPTAHVAMQLLLINYDDNAIVTTLRTDKYLKAENNSASAITAAYETLLQDIVRDLLAALAKHGKPAGE